MRSRAEVHHCSGVIGAARLANELTKALVNTGVADVRCQNANTPFQVEGPPIRL
jgi:uncharacterized metal-binding protein